jgi:hypothetical protein
MSAKPILRVGKIKSSGRSTPQSVHAHFARSRPTPNADPERTASNRWLVGSADKPLDQAITECMTKAGIDRTKLRKDAVLANDILLSVSPEWFRPDNPEASGTYDQNRVRAFAAEAQQFLRKHFGPRLVAAVLHLDEATPHVQAVVVPVMTGEGKKHRLSSKDYFSPDRLRVLQQAWEDQMRPHGVGPRTKGRRARHTTLREYYSALEATRTTDKRPKIEVGEPPPKKAFESTAAYHQRLGEWRRAEAKRLREELRPLAIEASRGRLYDAERRSGIQLRAALAEQGEYLARAYAQIAADKALIDRLRGTPIHAVAAALGYTGDIGKRENAIDLVKRVGKIDYKQAVAWLAQRFGPDTAVAAIQDEMRAKVVEVARSGPVLTKGERIKIDLVRKQLTALAAPTYRILAMREKGGEQIGQNVGKDLAGKDLLTRSEVLSMIPRLTALNASGANLFVTPVDQDVHHVLVDDLSADRLKELRSRGYSPAVVLESSPGNFQAVIKVAGPKDAVNSWFKDLNRDLGDAKIVGLRHPFRLAGFENRKEKHKQADGRFPFVRLVEAVNRLCGRSAAVVKVYMAQMAETALQSPRHRR